MACTTMLDTWPRHDSVGYDGGANLYEFVGSSPVAQTDPLGLRVFLTRDQENAEGGTIIIYNLIRYSLDDDLTKGLTPAQIDKKVKDVAKTHAELLEREFNKEKYVFDDGKFKWKIKLKMIITTEKELSEDDKKKELEGVKITDRKYDEISAKHNIDSYAWKKVKVVGKPFQKPDADNPGAVEEWFNSGNVPIDKGALGTFTETLEKILLHELVGHGMNNEDEYRTPELFPEDSIMNAGSKFYRSNLRAGIMDISNVTGKKRTLTDHTSFLDINDPWFHDVLVPSTAEVRQLELELLNKILGLDAAATQAATNPAATSTAPSPAATSTAPRP